MPLSGFLLQPHGAGDRFTWRGRPHFRQRSVEVAPGGQSRLGRARLRRLGLAYGEEKRLAKLILGFAGGLALAMAQNALYLDISQDWRRSNDDRPEYAQVDFDDRDWATVQSPA